MKPPVIDAEALAEFLDKAQSFVSPQDYLHWNHMLEQRAQGIRWALHDEAGCRQVVPATARIRPEQHPIWNQIHSSILRDVEQQPSRVVEILAQNEAPPWMWEWGTFWLAHLHPENYVWWTRWMYRSDTQTGAVALIVTDPSCLNEEPSVLYLRIVQASRFTEQVLDGWHRLSAVNPSFRHLVALSITYAVYLYTMTSWRFTKEFTQVLPSFPQVVSRLLGIPRWEGYIVAKSQSH